MSSTATGGASRRFSPFDAAFLPASGAVVDVPHRQPPSPLLAAGYVEVADPERELRTHAGRCACVLAGGEWLELTA